MAIELLVVEDSPTQAEQLRFLLEENGYRVRVAGDGAEGLAMAREKRPDLVISDVMMPRMDGFALSRAIRSDPALSDIPVVLLTTFASVHNIVRGLECGAHNFLRKPYDAEYLIQRVRNLINGITERRQRPAAQGFEFGIAGAAEGLDGEREQILDLLVSTYEQAIRMNAELERQRDALTQWQLRLAAMHQLAVRISDAGTPGELLDAAAEALLEFPGVEAVTIETLDPPRRVEHVTARDNDVWTDAAPPPPRRTAMSFPLQVAGRMLGSLVVTVHAESDLDLNDRTLLADMAYRIAVALERLQLLETLEERVRERTAALAGEVVERRRSEQQLRLSEERYRLLFERNLAGIVQTSLEGHILSCNSAYARLLGYEDPAELRGEDVTRFWEAAGDRQALIQRLQCDGQISSFEAELHRRNGHRLAVLCNLTLSRLEESGPVIETTLVDLTEYKRLEEQFRQAQKMESLGLLAGGIAHDFNNLLTIMSGYSEFLGEVLQGDEDLEKAVKGIQSAAVRASALTRQLLAFSRRQVMSLQLIDLNEMLAHDAQIFCRLLGRDIELSLHPFPGLGAINADRSQIEQVLLNLIVNARDAMPQGGRITISTRETELAAEEISPNTKAQPGRFAVLEVSDTGCGIDPAIAARIFEPFFSTKGEKGTGLGLSTVHGIIVQSGGFIRLHSVVGKGTTFTIFMPLAVSTRMPARLQQAAAPPVSGPVNVLLVEDEEDIRVMMAEFLAWKGFTVLSSRDPLEALDLCRRHDKPLHVLIADVNLPGMDGLTLAREVRALQPGVRVLFASGQMDQEPDAGCDRNAGELSAHFLPKPFTAQQLYETVKRLVEGDTAAVSA